MTSITPSSYYQLSGLQSGTGSTSNSSTGSAGSLTQQLVNALSAVKGGSQSNNNNNAYSLNLSQAAQQFLNGTASSSSSSTSNSSFTLTKAQEATINTILEKYKGQPMTQETFNTIQNDLEAAGLGADQLSAKDEISSFHTTSTLINDLNGNYSGLNTASNTTKTEQTKASHYMQSIMSAWQSLNSGSSS